MQASKVLYTVRMFSHESNETEWGELLCLETRSHSVGASWSPILDSPASDAPGLAELIGKYHQV